MKRTGNLYPEIWAMDNLERAHKHARRGKGWYPEVCRIDAETEAYLEDLQNKLITKTYNTSDYITFEREENGKKRLIYKLPYYPDRVCQWAIIQVLEPYFMKYITADTYSAIPGRGIHLGLKKLKKAIQEDPEGTEYCLKLDVKKYYPSISHRVLKQLMRRMFKDKDLLWLLDEIIDSTEGDTGIPIGNYMSQWFGNLYLARFDHWLKEVVGVKYYYRYMDDIIILSGSKEELREILTKIEMYFTNELELKIKENYQIFPVASRGIDFLGYRVFPEFVLLRKTTAKNMKIKIRSTWKTIDSKGMMSQNQWCAINSYGGWLIWCNGYRLKTKYLKPLEEHCQKYYKEVIKHDSLFKCA